jgi:hypothetical protein
MKDLEQENGKNKVWEEIMKDEDFRKMDTIELLVNFQNHPGAGVVLM